MSKNTESKTKIMAIEPLGDGGLAHYTFNLLNALVKANICVSLFTNKKYELDARRPNFKVHNNMYKITNWLIERYSSLDKEFGANAKLRRLLKLLEYPFNILEAIILASKFNTRIIHIQSVNSIDILFVLFFKLMNKKIVFTIHNVNPRHGDLKFYHYPLFTILYNLCDQLIIHSEEGKAQIKKLFSVPNKKINVIPHGDYKFFVPETAIHPSDAKKNLGISAETKTILFFGTIRPSKGLINILKALPLIKQKIPNIKLLIVGELYEDFSNFRQFIDEHKLKNNVYLRLDYIPQEDVATYFFASDLVVLPYNEITQSGVLQIAYAFAKPLVATDLAGFREVIEDGVNGYLTSLGDIQELAKKSVDVLTCPEKIKSMGARSLQLSDLNFSWHSIALKTKKIYESLLTSKVLNGS